MKNGCMENETYRLNWVLVDKIDESLFEAVANDMGKFPEKYKNVKVVERDKIIEALKNVDNYLQKIADLEQELAELKQKAIVLEKAFELACDPRDDWGGKEYSGTEFDNYHDYFIAEAEQKLAEIGVEDE